MHLPFRSRLRHSLLLGGLTAALLTTRLSAQVQIDYSDGQTDATTHDTSSTLTLSILSGTATQSGALTGSGRLLKVGDGTLILSGSNTYTNDTVVHGGTLQVVTGGTMSQVPANIFIADVTGDIGALLISGGTVSDNSGYIGTHTGSSGTVTMSGGTWTSSGELDVGYYGSGILNLSGGRISSGDLNIGYYGTGVLNLSGGRLSSAYAYVGGILGATGTANVSGGTWTSSGDLYIGFQGTGTVNLTDAGTITVGAAGGGGVILGQINPGSGTLNLGTGGAVGTLNAGTILGGSSGGTVNFNHTGAYTFAPTLTGRLAVNFIGPGTTTLSAANTYSGATSVLAGTLELSFGAVSSNILPTTTALTLGSGTLRLTGEGTQTLSGLYITQYSSSSSIVLGAHETLDVSQISLSDSFNTLNFNTAAGGANGATAGSGNIVIHGLSFGSAIASYVTVTDATGFGLATVNAGDQIIRLTSSPLLPASGASTADYLINNNNGGSAAAGSSSLIVTASQSVGSFTVDTTATSGTLTLSSGVVLSSNVWNFGGAGSNAYAITGGGITTVSAGGLLQINNFNTAPVTLYASILDNDGSGLRVAGPGTTVLAGTNSYLGDTNVSTGVLEVADGGSITGSYATITIGSWSGGNAVFNIHGGTVTDLFGVLAGFGGSNGVATVGPDGQWNNSDSLRVGLLGTGVLNITGGTVTDTDAELGYVAASQGTVTMTAGTWTTSNILNIGREGAGVINLSGGSITATLVNQGYSAGSSGALNVSSGTFTINTSYFLGYTGSAVLNLSGGSLSNAASSVGFDVGGSGTANVSGGTWTNYNGIVFGESGTGVLNLSGGSVTADVLFEGLNAGSSGTVNVSSGTLTSNTSYFLGYTGSGVLNLSGGGISNASSSVGVQVGGSGTANVSGGSWTNNGSIVIGESGTGVLNLSGGSVSATSAKVGLNADSRGTANVSGGSWAVAGLLEIGSSGTGILNISGGSITSNNGYLGSYDNGIGTTNVSGGSWTISQDLIVGLGFIGVMNISGGSVTSTTASLAQMSDGHGTVNVSGGLWTVTSPDATFIGYRGTGVVNLTDAGTITLGPDGGGTLALGGMYGSSGTLNLGTGGVAGTLNAASVYGGNGATVNFNHTGEYAFTPQLTGDMTVKFTGPGTTILSTANTYTGVTAPLGGTLELRFGGVAADILPSTTDLALGSAVLQLSGTGTQSLNSLAVRSRSAARVLLGENETLTLGGVRGIRKYAALNFYTGAGGANGASVGTSVVVVNGQSSGVEIHSGMTVTDSTGFGLAAVNESNQLYRLTNTPLLPASGADSTTSYLITTGGSSTSQVTASETVRTLTVDTTATDGTLVLGSNVTLSNDVWNFGGANGGHQYAISGGALTSATAGGILQINNYNRQAIFIGSPITDNGGMTLLFQGIGATVLNGTSTGLQDVQVTSGALVVTYGGSFSYTGTTTIGSQTGDNAVLYIFEGSVQGSYGVIGDAAGALGTVLLMQNGSWIQPNGDLILGKSGTGVLTISDGGTSQTQNGYLGMNAGSSGTATLENGGTWYMNRGLHIGGDGAGLVNFNGGTLTVGGESHNGTITLGAQGVLNIGTGAGTGTLRAGTITGASGSVVNFNYNSYYRPPAFSTPLAGDLAVTKSGGGSLVFTSPMTYTGGTTLSSGTLFLMLGFRSGNYLSPQSALTMGGGTFKVFGGGTQTMNGLSTLAGAGGFIELSMNSTLNLGTLTSIGSGSALNFDVSSGEGNGSTVGLSIVTLTGLTPGVAINPGFTVTDSTGFGLATVNADNQIIRITDSDRLPHVGSDPGKDYLVDNSDTESDQPGSTRLHVSASETARSITVDTSSASASAAGTLTLGTGAVLSSDVWNFGAFGAHNYEIKTDGDGAGISSATPGGVLQINNYNGYAPVIISAPVLDHEGSGLRVAGTGLTFLNGSNTYTGETVINSGTLYINGNESAATGDVIVQSAARLGGTGTLGGNLIVQNGGMVDPGNNLGAGTLNGTTATFATSSIFHVLGLNDAFTSLHLTGAITIAPGALLAMDVIPTLTQSSYTLLSAASGLDASTPFTLAGGTSLPDGYQLVYTGTALELDVIPPATAFWTGKVDSNWSSLNSGTTNWATAADGLTDTTRLPDSPTDVTFSATGVGTTRTNLDGNFTINSLTINSDTSISSDTQHRLIVNTTTTVNALLVMGDSVKFVGKGDMTISSEGALAGSGAQMERDQSIFVNGAIRVGDQITSAAQVLSLNTSGTAATVMGAGSSLFVNLYSGAGLGDNTALRAAGDRVNLYGTLDATAGGTLVIGNPHAMTAFAGGDQWKIIELNSGRGNITGHLALNDSGLGLTTGFVGSFDESTGIYSIADHRPEMTAQSSGLPMANAEGQAILSGSQTATNDVNNHLFNLRAGGGEEDGPDGSIASSMDDGVIVGQGDGPDSPIAKRIKRTRQWEVFTTVNYGNVRLNPISSQSGVQIDSWASSVGIERHLSRGLTLGFAATFLQSTQTYTGGLGRLDLEGPTLSAYVSYVKKAFWSSLLYSFGDYDLGSSRNPGLGLPTASGATNAYTNAIQYNTGWNFRFQNNTLVTGPFAGIDYLHGTVDGYNETGGGAGALHYNKQTFESLVTRVGWSASKKIETDWATITPQLRLSYERQNVRNNGTSVNLINAPFNASGGNQSPGQDYLVIGTGVNFQFSPVFSMMLGYQTQIFRNNMTSHFGSVRFGYKF